MMYMVPAAGNWGVAWIPHITHILATELSTCVASDCGIKDAAVA
jgi:hypothetical protein